MAWKIEWEARALKEAEKLDASARRAIFQYLEERIATKEDPRRFGKGLSGPLAGLWRYRVGSYRVICRIEDKQLVVLVVRVGDRKNVYD